MGVGECDVSAIDEYGNKATIHVTVKKGYIIDRLERNTTVDNAWYGTKKLVISSDLGTSGKVLIGKDKYKFSIKQSSEWPVETAKVKLKKVYKLNTKATVYVTKKSNGVSCTYKKKIKLSSATWIPKASGKKKKLTLTINNAHKGDVVKVTYKGKTVKKKITKNRDGKDYKVVLTMKKTLKSDSSIKVVILNKDNKKLESVNIILRNGKYEYEDPDEYTGSEDEGE